MGRTKQQRQASGTLSVAFLNVCSLRRKTKEVEAFLSTRGIQVFGMAETWLTPAITDGELEIPHYKLYRKDRIGQTGGGVGIYCHDSVVARRRQDLETDIELLWLEITGLKESMLVGCCYRPPNQLADYWDALESNLELAVHRQSRRIPTALLLGDFNVDVSKPSSSAMQVIDLFSRFGLTNYVTSPTRVTRHTETLIDLLLSTSSIAGPCETVFLDISDHYGVLAHTCFHINAFSSGSGKRPTRRLHRVNWENFNRDLAEKQAGIPEHADIDELASAFTQSIITTLDEHAPVVMRRKRDTLPCPWLTTELVNCVRERNRLHRLLVRDKLNVELRNQHREARAKARKLDRTLKNQYFIDQCRTTDQRKLWSVINTVVGRKKQSRAPQASMADLTSLFGDVVTDPHRPPTLEPREGPPGEISLRDFNAVSPDDVSSCLKSVNSFKATGSDSVPCILLHKCCRTLAPVLTRIINLSLSTGLFPKSYKVAHISPLLKGGDATLAKNYRPVSLLPVVSRIVEAIVKEQITAYLEAHDLLPPTQFAYRRLHSTEDALTHAISHWQLARSERKFTGIVFVDLSKAFDRVKHDRLIDELFNLGVTGTALRWFCSYLDQRHQCVKLNGELSQPVPCTRGVPQGSVLGPLLFVLYTAGIASVIPSSASHQEFADDIVLSSSNRNAASVCSSLSSAVSNLADWLDDAGLLLNAEKTQVLFIKPRGANDIQQHVRCRGKVLETAESAKYLGVVIDDKLSWTAHVSHLSRKTACTIGQLWRHGHTLSFKARQTWYISMIQAQLCYGSNCFLASISQQLLDKLHKLSKSGIRAALLQRRLVPTAPLLTLLHISSLPQLLNIKFLVFIHRCLHDRASPLLLPLFSAIAPHDTPSQSRVTRAQVTSLLRVPFLPGPYGRRTVEFIGSTFWNALPIGARTEHDAITFKALVSSLDLVSLRPH